MKKGSLFVRRDIPTAFLALLALSACQPMPTTTRNGDVRDVLISERPGTVVVEVKVGEEIRWTNVQAEPVRIVFMNRISSQISCRRNFCGYFTGGAEAFLKHNQSASLCFRNSGAVPYTVIVQSALSKERVSRQELVQIDAPSKSLSVPQEPATP